MEYRLPYFVRRILSVIEGFRTNKWFKFDPKITMSFVPCIKDKYVPDADIILVTWWTTASEVGLLSSKKGKKINLIQGFENWTGHLDLLYKSYNLPETTNVVVASYLKKIVDEHSIKTATIIPNAINGDQFYISGPIEERDPLSICMMYSIQEIKGSKYGLEALYKLKEIHPDLKVELFGICPEPEGLPGDWMVYSREPDLNGLFNRNSVYITNSFTEGMALTPMEAMQSGCALVCTDIPGHSEYAKDNETALLFQVKNTDELVAKVDYLINNNQQRIELAKQGNKLVGQFTWDEAVLKMNNLIKKLLKG